MESFLNAAVIWFIIGFVFLLLEFGVPGLILFFFAVGAWIVAAICLLYTPTINTQLIIFLASSLITIFLFRKWVKNLLYSRKHATEVIEDDFIGKTAKAQTAISSGKNGKVDFNGTSWDASSADTIAPDEKVIIIGNESILLIVKSKQTL